MPLRVPTAPSIFFPTVSVISSGLAPGYTVARIIMGKLMSGVISMGEPSTPWRPK